MNYDKAIILSEKKIKGGQVLYWNKKEIYLTKKSNIYKELSLRTSMHHNEETLNCWNHDTMLRDMATIGAQILEGDTKAKLRFVTRVSSVTRAPLDLVFY